LARRRGDAQGTEGGEAGDGHPGAPPCPYPQGSCGQDGDDQDPGAEGSLVVGAEGLLAELDQALGGFGDDGVPDSCEERAGAGKAGAELGRPEGDGPGQRPGDRSSKATSPRRHRRDSYGTMTWMGTSTTAPPTLASWSPLGKSKVV